METLILSKNYGCLFVLLTHEYLVQDELDKLVIASELIVLMSEFIVLIDSIVRKKEKKKKKNKICVPIALDMH